MIFTYAELNWSTDFSSGRDLEVRTTFKNMYHKIVSDRFVQVTPYPKTPKFFHWISFIARKRRRISGRRLSPP